jgi:transcriptional regulator with XRE-family HTH domain
MVNSNKLSKNIGARIMDRRKQLGLTQEQAAEKAGLSHQFFSCVETGRKNLRAESVIRVAAALGTSTDYILTGRTNENDTKDITKKLLMLEPKQLHCLECILNNFLLALNKNP